jgi:hypothetical protein
MRGALRTGVTAFTVPMFDPAGQLAGLAAKAALGQACCNVVSREGNRI